LTNLYSCEATASCKNRTISYKCNFTFSMEDRFEDIFSRKHYNKKSVEIGIKYNIYAEWQDSSCGNIGF